MKAELLQGAESRPVSCSVRSGDILLCTDFSHWRRFSTELSEYFSFLGIFNNRIPNSLHGFDLETLKTLLYSSLLRVEFRFLNPGHLRNKY